MDNWLVGPPHNPKISIKGLRGQCNRRCVGSTRRTVTVEADNADAGTILLQALRQVHEALRADSAAALCCVAKSNLLLCDLRWEKKRYRRISVERWGYRLERETQREERSRTQNQNVDNNPASRAETRLFVYPSSRVGGCRINHRRVESSTDLRPSTSRVIPVAKDNKPSPSPVLHRPHSTGLDSTAPNAQFARNTDSDRGATFGRLDVCIAFRVPVPVCNMRASYRAENIGITGISRFTSE
ncbi:hypothetical protein DFH06DRAFT_1138429 [Mycena polygramma]|nr:hypothetical protein DFH06DRAFT_1138429 [Mycena polygramma]